MIIRLRQFAKWKGPHKPERQKRQGRGTSPDRRFCWRGKEENWTLSHYAPTRDLHSGHSGPGQDVGLAAAIS